MKNEKSREQKIVTTSLVSVAANLLLVGFKTAVGFASNSIAIISDAVNNLSDVLSSVITIVGTKLAGKPADKKHPYGYGRIEHVTSFFVSAIVLYAGITALFESVEKIINPQESSYDTTTIIVLIAAIFVKLALSIFVRIRGKKLKSTALVASGIDAFNDFLLSISVLASALLHITFGISIEAYVGILVSVMIIKTGIDLIRDSVDNMIGTRVESKLAKKIKREIAKEPEVRGAYDLILHDFGPNKYLGSVHIEIPDDMEVAEVDKISRRISTNIQKKYGVILHTIGIYSINTKDKEIAKIEEEIRRIVFSHDEILQMHGLYIDKIEQVINFDIIIDFATKNQEAVYKQIHDETKHAFSDYKINITLDADLSD